MSGNIFNVDTLSSIGEQVGNLYTSQDLNEDISDFTQSSYNQDLDIRGGFSGDQQGYCMSNGNRSTDTWEDCIGDGKQWIQSVNSPWGGCFNSENNYLEGVSQIQCSDNGRVWNDNYLKPTDYLGTGDTLDDVVGTINNGRVSSITETSTINPQLAQDIILHKDNQENSVKGIVEETALSTYFVSKDNTDNIQDTIRYRVYKNTNKVISRQSSNELFIIMRSILLQHGNFKVSQTDLADEILKLNEMVLDYAVDKVSTMVVQYEGYISDLHNLPPPIDRPSYTNNRDYTFDISNILS